MSGMDKTNICLNFAENCLYFYILAYWLIKQLPVYFLQFSKKYRLMIFGNFVEKHMYVPCFLSKHSSYAIEKGLKCPNIFQEKLKRYIGEARSNLHFFKWNKLFWTDFHIFLLEPTSTKQIQSKVCPWSDLKTQNNNVEVPCVLKICELLQNHFLLYS